MENKINIAVIGTTGVGKSTLINYLLPDLINKPEARPGEPVTVKGFHLFEGVIEGTIDNEKRTVAVNCYDSWGLEVDKYEEWMRGLKDALNSRGVDKSPSDWFHSIFYLIDASGSRVQENDIKLIKLLIENQCRVNVIFSKSDLVSEEESDLLHGVLRKHFGDTIPIADICSQEKKTRSGYHESFGKQIMIKFIIKDVMMILIDRLPVRFKVIMNPALENLRQMITREAHEDISWFTANNDADMLRDKIKKIYIPLIQDNIMNSIRKINEELDGFIGGFQLFISTVGLESLLEFPDFKFYDFFVTLDPVIWANIILNRQQIERQKILLLWGFIDGQVKKIVDKISDDIKSKLEHQLVKLG